MNIAFYAPLKSPDHPIPSGDRLIANLLLMALKKSGHAPRLAARFRSYDRQGNAERQRRLKVIGERMAGRLARRFSGAEVSTRPGCWVTYHLYHKAPDWIGPHVARELGIPYVVIEASVAPKQKDGPWHQGFLAATEAIAGADMVISLNRKDMACVESVRKAAGRLVYLGPFLDLDFLNGCRQRADARISLAQDLAIPSDRPWLITVAMMRQGNKLDSYRVLAQALREHQKTHWHLLVIGDGAARSKVEAAFSAFDPSRVRFLGLRSREEIAQLLQVSDLFVWPAVAEPLGMAMLEAQAAGLPVVAGNSGGVPDIVRHGETGLLTPPGDARAFSEAAAALLHNADLRRAMGERARARVRSSHSLDAASAALGVWLNGLSHSPAS